MLKSVSSVTNAIGALNYIGAWNANTNSPAIISSAGVKGDYYVIGVAGTTTIDGISNWGVGDWIVFNGSTWQRVEGGADGNFVTLSTTSDVTIGGTTKCGPNSPAVYCTIFTNTTNSSQGSARYITHGLDMTKVVDWECLVYPNNTFGWMKRNFTKYGGYEFEAWLGATQLACSNSSANSSAILGVPLKFLLWHTA